LDFPKIEELIAKIEARITDPEKREMAAVIATDLVGVSLLAMTHPERAKRQLAHLTAQVANLSAMEAQMMASDITEWVMDIVSITIRGLVVA
jgi:hypothetical protein